MEILYASLIIFFAYFIRSVCGFGGSSLSLPLLIIFMDLPDIVLLLTLLTLATSTVVVRKSWKHVDKDMVIKLMVGALPTSLIGVYLLTSLEPVILLKVLGVVLVLFAWNFMRKKSLFVFPSNKKARVFAGMISGLLGGLFSTSSAPIVAYLSTIYKDPKVLRATMLAFFLMLNIVKLLGFISAGSITSERLEFFIYILPAMFAASYLGQHVHTKIPERVLKIAIALLMVVSGVFLLIK